MRTDLNGFLELFRPTEMVDSITQLTVDGLRSRGINALLVDLDNTLVPWSTREITNQVRDWLKTTQDAGVKICIVSNTSSSRRLKALSSELGIPHANKGAKPRRKGFREAMGLLAVDPSCVAVVGDQIFTDILGGNRLGVRTILVRPIGQREFFGTKISRVFERMLLRHFQAHGPGFSSEFVNASDFEREQSSETQSQK
jgi:hypothetical protein